MTAYPDFGLAGGDTVSFYAVIPGTEQKLANVIGVLPGKSKKDEYVVFSGHYDHLGIGRPDAKGDSIYNGANDDAAGTTRPTLNGQIAIQLDFIKYKAEKPQKVY